jgi:oxaloacetate decarboxylase alpha subunit
VPRLVDTSIRVLGQEPFVGVMPTSAQLELARVLDGAGFAYLEVSGGGAFEAAVRRGVESPWERIRALKAHTKTPLALALRGRFLVGATPVGGEIARRFVATAAESGIDAFRLHDPLNDLDNLRQPAEAVLEAGRELDVGLLYGSHRREAVLDSAKRVPEIGATRIVLDDPAGLLEPARAGELVEQLRELSGLPVGLYCQGAGRNALAVALEAARRGVDVIACAVYPVALADHRISVEAAAEALVGLGLDTGVDQDTLWTASELVDEHLGDTPASPLLPRIAARAARRKMPVQVVAAADVELRARNAGDRIDEVLDEIERVRVEAGSPPLAAPIGHIIGTQALVNVLGANRYATIVDEVAALVGGRFGTTPGPIDPALARAVSLRGEESAEEPLDLEALRESAKGLASSEEELLLLAVFGSDAERLLRSVRERAGGEDTPGARGVEQTREERIRAVVRIVQETGIDEITVEEGGMRVSVRRTPELPGLPSVTAAPEASGPGALDEPAIPPLPDGLVRVESPMVGTFYRAPSEGEPPFVEEGDPVAAGQTLCILEAMKLMNPVKAEIEGIVRGIHVGNAEPVEYGQLLFELEPLNGRPLGI